MRKKNHSEQKRLQPQTSSTIWQENTVDAEISAAELQEFKKKADEYGAEIAALERLADQMTNNRDILQKKLDGIPLLPHEEAILNSMLKAHSHARHQIL